MDFETRDRLGTLAAKLEAVHALLFILQAVMDRDTFTTRDFAPAVGGICDYLSTQVDGLLSLCRQTESAAGQTAGQ